MPINFEVQTDSRNRVLGFSPLDSKEVVGPAEFGQSYAGETLVHKGEEYDLDPNGNLVHAGVEVPEDIKLGHGILIGNGVEFEEGEEKNDDTHELDIEDHVLIQGTKIKPGFHLGHHAVILAHSVGAKNTIGNHARVGHGASTGSNVHLFPSVKVGARASIGRNTMLKRNVRIPADAHIGAGVFIAHTVELVPGDYARSGRSILVADGVRIETPRRRISANVHESIIASRKSK